MFAIDRHDIKMSATNENTTFLRGKKKTKGVTIDVDDPTDMTGILNLYLFMKMCSLGPM